MRTISLKLALFILVMSSAADYDYEECRRVSKCTCKRTSQKDGYLIKMTCGEKNKVIHLDELELLYTATELVQLNLSNNNLKSFTPKVQLTVLQKLDLSRNQISELTAHQFTEIPKLRRLDLSANVIKYIDILAFEGLKHLERLKLNQNQISVITLGTFAPLENIKQLDISSNPLVCDCGLLWLLDWSQKHSVKLLSNPKCSAPTLFKGHPLRKLKIGDDIHCVSPAGSSGIPLIELRPSEDQVVFEADSFSIQCLAPSFTDSYEDEQSSKIEWTWLDSDPKMYFSDISIEEQMLPSAGRIWSTLTINKLTMNHTGTWKCLYLSVQGNHSKGITLLVISDLTRYCPMTVTSNNKGTYHWPRTIVNYTVTMPCESINLNYNASKQQVTYHCSEIGEWVNLNTTMCSYISDTTKILEQFSIVNSSIVESAKHFKNYTLNRTIFKDVMDLIFAVTTIENYIKYVPFNDKATVASILIDVVNNLMELPRFYLREADVLYKACQRLLKAMEDLIMLNPTSNFHKSNFAIEVFPVKKEGFLGLKCTWYVNPNNKNNLLFSCVSSTQQETGNLQGKIIEASVTIPENLFDQLQIEQGINLTNKVYDILINMHSTNKFFPIDEKRKGKEDVTTAIVGTKIVDLPVTNLTKPVFVMIRTPYTTAYEVTPFTPVRWDPLLNNGTGGWSSEGCHFRHELPDHLVFSCQKFGYYGLLQDITHLQDFQGGARFKLSHPAIYVGAFILILSLLIAILTYVLCYRMIQMPKKAKHSLVNMWIAISLVTFMYIFGIYQTEDMKICQVVGMVLHYLTLCSLLWMCVGVNCMYKRLSKNDVINLQDDDLPSEMPVQKPILGLYLVGWGIGLIICGLSAAININEYASATHCFLKTGPAFSAIYVPVIILIVFLCVFFLLIRCAIYNLDANGHLSEGTQATEHVDLDLLEPNFPNIETRSVSTKTASSETEDPEHAPSAQLKAHIIFLLIYLMTWLSCAFATVPPFKAVSFEEDLFSVAFFILATTLGAFNLFFYCVARNDVRTQWVLFMRWMKRTRLRSRHVHDTPSGVPPVQIQPLPPPPVSNAEVVSRSTSRSSNNTKSNSHNSNILKGAVDLNGSFSDHHGAKINNVNLVVLHRAQYRTSIVPNIIENPTNAAEVFYNPHQSTVARKFFRRQKRNMMKKNNLVKLPRDVNSDSASVFSERPIKAINNMDQNIFGTNSKVNNTNIHVEHTRKVTQKNPNLFSDSAEDFDSVSNIPMENIVINADRLRKKELPRYKGKKKSNTHLRSLSERSENNMRSVSQQCTLEYSSETISDSILDKTSPDKPVQENFMTENNEVLPPIRRENSPLSMLTENDPNYCQINEIHPTKLLKKSHTVTYPKNAKPKSSDLSYSLDNSMLMSDMYVNPPHGMRMGKGDGQSQASSMSVSDIDELYQQIRRGPMVKRNRYLYGLSEGSPCLSDSEINSFVGEVRFRRRASHSHDRFDFMSDDVETTV